jgi:DNA-binding response OmpR family regulator
MAKILICDDEPGLRAVIKRYAQLDGHEAAEAGNGIEAIEACKKQQFDIIVMDIMMPKLDGFSAVKEIRKTSDVPIIMLSARGEEYDKVSGFEYGVDDYVVKPLSSKEIMLRITAILRRKTAAAPASDKGNDTHAVFTKDGFSADMTAYKMFIDGKQVELAPKLYDLLFFLIRNRGVAVSREKILTSVWGYKNIDDVRTLDTHIKLLRKAMGPYASLVTTLRTHGYRFEG